MEKASEQEKLDFQKFVKSIESLSGFKKRVVEWLIDNWEVTEPIFNQKVSISDEKIEEKLREAEAKGEVATYALYICLKLYLQETKEKRQGEPPHDRESEI